MNGPADPFQPLSRPRGHRARRSLLARGWDWGKHHPFVKAGIFASALAVFVVAFAGSEYLTTRKQPLEQARVTALRDTGEDEFQGKNGSCDVLITTFSVERPPTGLPATFTYRGCELAEVNEVVPLIRIGTGAEADVYPNPLGHLWEVPLIGAGIFGIVFPLSAMLFGGTEIVGQWGAGWVAVRGGRS